MVLAIFALSVSTRALFLGEVRVDPTYRELGHDEGVNDKVARAILSGDMPAVSFYKAPLYMYALAGIYRLLGEDPMRARWVQIFIDSLSPVLVLLIARRFFGSLVGAIAGVVAALFWTFVFYSAELVDTSLACVFYLLLAYVLVALPDDRWTKWVLAGVALGLGAITRPNVLAFAPVLAILVVLVGWLRERREATQTGRSPSPLRLLVRPTRNAVLLTVGCCSAIAPVTLHNRLVAGQWVPIATYGGLNFYVANSPYSDGKHGPLLVQDGVPDISSMDPNNIWSRLDLNYNIAKTYAQNRLGRRLTMAEVDAFFYDLTRQYIRENPRKFVSDCFKRFCWFFNQYEFPNVKDLYRLCGVSSLLQGLSHFHFGILCPIALVGVFLSVTRRGQADGMVYYAAMLASLFLPGVLFVMNSRYRLPTVYLLVPFAAYAVVAMVELWRSRSGWPVRLGTLCLLAGGALASNLDLFGYSKAHHTELKMTYAHACMQVKDRKKLAIAVARFEDAYFEEMAGGGRPWANILQHCSPMGWMFLYHHLLEDDAKAMRFGELMVAREPFNPDMFLPYFKLLLDQQKPVEARRVLDRIEQGLLAAYPENTIECFMQYHSRFGDMAVLRHVEKLLVPLSGKNPDRTYFHFTLYKVRKMLEMTGGTSRPGTAPASGPTSRSAPRP